MLPVEFEVSDPGVSLDTFFLGSTDDDEVHFRLHPDLVGVVGR